MFVDVTKDSSSASTNWVAESGVLDLFFLLGPTPPKVRSESQSLQPPLLCCSAHKLQLTMGATAACPVAVGSCCLLLLQPGVQPLCLSRLQ